MPRERAVPAIPCGRCCEVYCRGSLNYSHLNNIIFSVPKGISTGSQIGFFAVFLLVLLLFSFFLKQTLPKPYKFLVGITATWGSAASAFGLSIYEPGFLIIRLVKIDLIGLIYLISVIGVAIIAISAFFKETEG